MDGVDDVHKLLEMVQSLCRAGKFDEAKQLCDTVQTTDSQKQARVFVIRSHIARDENDFDQERDYLFESLQIDPKNRGTHHSLLRYYVKVGSYHDALDITEELIALDQEFQAFTESAYIHAAFCHFKLQNYIAAKECLTKCAEIDDVIPISGAKMKSGELRRAIKQLG